MHHVLADRGGHAHTETDQVIVAVSGCFKVDVSDGAMSVSFLLDDPTVGLYVPRMLFQSLYQFSADAVCLVLASTHYDMSKSIRSWDAYRAAIAEAMAPAEGQ